uniref:Lysozyme n=1 Tax=Rhodothermus marinus TaxID=29549 RepID=A0A7V2F643_RHOMR
MSPEAKERLRRMLIVHEGLRLKPYRDAVGKLTIGYGRNLEDVGISLEEAELMLEHDLDRAIQAAKEVVPGFDVLDEVRQAVLVNMAFNIGRAGLASFKRMRAALALGDFERAASEMLDSLWARQVGRRAQELAEMMRTGQWTSWLSTGSR